MKPLKRMAVLSLLSVIALAVITRPLLAEGSFAVDPAQVKKVKSGKTSVFCAVTAGRWVAGRYVVSSSQFSPSSVVIARLKLKIKKAKKADKSRFQALLTKEQRYFRLGKPLCEQFNTATPTAGTATPDAQPTAPVAPTATITGNQSPTPGPTKTPAPVVSPTVAAVCIDQTQRATLPGCFGIPTPNVGNIDRGATLSRSMNCTGCHGEKQGSTYARLTGSFRNVSDMRNLTPKNPQDTYDLVAYLNRFSP